jgi:hypothetical protein
MERVDTCQQNYNAVPYHGLHYPIPTIDDDVSDDAQKARSPLPSTSTSDLTLAQQLAQRLPLFSPSHTVMERSLAVAHDELRSVGFEASLENCPALSTPPPSVPVFSRTTEAVSTPASTVVPTVVPPPSVDPYQLILEQRLLDLEKENSNLREAASHLSTSNQPFSQEINMAEIPISIAYPAADKVTAFAQHLKQDSQIQSFASSSTPSMMYPVEVEVDSVPPPLASVVQSTTDPDSSSSSSTRSSSNHRRIQPIPIQINAVDKRSHFPSKLHAYFVNDDYVPDMPQFEKDFLNDCIIYHCCRNDKMIQLPPFSEAILQGINPTT